MADVAKAKGEAVSETKEAWSSETARRVALFVPLILVNAFAVFGQAGWAYDHVTPSAWQPWFRWAVAVLFACSLESIGVYLAIEAHGALMADQASGLLRAGSYGVGLVIGALNYNHFLSHRHHAVTAAALAFGLLSAISPWLWAIRSRALNRSRLRELRLLDERGVKLSTSRKFWHPIKSVQVLSWAAWAGVNDPAAAVSGWAAAHPEKASKPRSPASGLPTSPAQVAGPKPRPAAPAPSAPTPPGGQPPATAVPSRGRNGRGRGKRATPDQKALALHMLGERQRPAEVALAIGVSKRTVELWRAAEETNGGGGDGDVEAR